MTLGSLHTIPGWPECSQWTGKRRRRSRIAYAVVEKSEAVAADGVHVPGRLRERVRAADGDQQRQAGPEQSHVDRHPTAASTTTHVDRSTHLDVPGASSVRAAAAAVAALRRAVARHRDQQVPVTTSQLRHEPLPRDVIRSDPQYRVCVNG